MKAGPEVGEAAAARSPSTMCRADSRVWYDRPDPVSSTTSPPVAPALVPSHAYIDSSARAMSGFSPATWAAAVMITRSASQLMLRLLTHATISASGADWWRASSNGSQPAPAARAT